MPRSFALGPVSWIRGRGPSGTPTRGPGPCWGWTAGPPSWTAAPAAGFSCTQTYSSNCSVPDPDPDPDPPDPHVFGPPGSGSLYHQAKIVRKTLISTVLWLHGTLIFENDINLPSKSNKQKNFIKNSFLLASWRSMTKTVGSGSGSGCNVWMWMRSSLVVRTSDCQCRSCNSTAWVRSQYPPTQWNLRGGRWSSVE